MLTAWGRKAEDLIGKKFSELGYPPEVVTERTAIFARVYAGEEVKTESYFKNSDGQSGWYENIFVPVFDSQGLVQAISGTTRDVTAARQSAMRDIEVQKAKIALLKDEEYELQFREFAQSIPLLAWIANPDGYITWYNQRWFDYTGTNLSEMQGWGWQSVHDPMLLPSVVERWSTSIKTGQHFEMEFPLRGKDGQFRWFITRVQPLRDSLGQVLKWIGTNTDIHEQMMLAEQLRESKLEAERTNQLKSEFLANMSHELRTPLGAMIGFTELLRDRELSVEDRENYIDVLHRNGGQLSRVINDILDLSKVEAGHLLIELEAVDSQRIVQEVVDLLVIKAREKKIDLSFESQLPIGEKIVTDPHRLKQIVLNIVGNALKFTPAGSVKISIGPSESQRGIDILVVDSGIGIPEKHRETIFNMFSQADSSMTRKLGGTGLGLTLSKKLAQSLGGDLKLKTSIEGKGSAFLIQVLDAKDSRLPSRPEFQSENSLPVKLDIKVLQRLKILVVDDSIDNRMLISLALKKYGATVDLCENGLAAIQAVTVKSYDIVLMDIQMPVMDGYAATTKLRSGGFQGPIIALTAHAMEEVRKKCYEVGCTDHLAKPINFDTLVACLVRNAPVAIPQT